MNYATKDDLIEYLGISGVNMPSDIERLIKRAEDLIDYATFYMITPGEGAKKATCAQVEYWLEMDETVDIVGAIESFSLSQFSINYGENKMPVLAPRARRILLRTGLLYRGVGVK